MRWVTPEEYAALRELADDKDLAFDDGDRGAEIRDSLVLQGRAVYVVLPFDAEFDGEWHISPLGREALRLYPLMRPPEAP